MNKNQGITLAVIIALCLVMAACGSDKSSSTNSTPKTHTTRTTTPDVDITPSDLISYMETKNPDVVEQFCEEFAIIGNDDVSREQFDRGYNSTAGENPAVTADDLYDELKDRCP
jgi:hypothetical protein